MLNKFFENWSTKIVGVDEQQQFWKKNQKSIIIIKNTLFNLLDIFPFTIGFDDYTDLLWWK